MGTLSELYLTSVKWGVETEICIAIRYIAVRITLITGKKEKLCGQFSPNNVYLS